MRRTAFILLAISAALLLSGCEGFFDLPMGAPVNAPTGQTDNSLDGQGPTAEDSQERTVAAEEFLSLRAEPDTTAAVLRKLDRGTVVLVKDRAGSFSFVEVKETGETGYVLSSYLRVSEAKDPPTGTAPSGFNAIGMEVEASDWVAICEKYLTLREKPSLAAKALGRINPNETVRVYGFNGLFARVSDKAGRKGYVLSGYLTPAKPDKHLSGLDVVKPADEYSYTRMMKDLNELARLHPDRLRLKSAGKSAQGRDIPVAVLGDPKAAHHVLVQGAVHGREHMTALLLMAQLEYCLKFGGESAGVSTVSQSLRNVCLHILPMANPDGVTISQTAEMNGTLNKIYQQDMNRNLTDLPPGDYLRQWKANAAGVDINRNFPNGWQQLDAAGGPSYARWKGNAPADQPETQALIGYTRSRDFSATVSYHAYGSCIYWEFGEKEAVNGKSRTLAEAIAACTGYPLASSEGLDGGGYKDWVMDELGIPSVTVEVGTRECPLPLVEFSAIWARNRNALAAVARWVAES